MEDLDVHSALTAKVFNNSKIFLIPGHGERVHIGWRLDRLNKNVLIKLN
jgi:hypothetical protein